jgi:hypothetical protein
LNPNMASVMFTQKYLLKRRLVNRSKRKKTSLMRIIQRMRVKKTKKNQKIRSKTGKLMNPPRKSGEENRKVSMSNKLEKKIKD